MKYSLDPDFQESVVKTFEELGIPPGRPRPKFPKGDVEARRKGAGLARLVLQLDPEVPGIAKTRYTAPTKDGYDVPIFAYRKQMGEGSGDLQPAVMYCHGGGMILGSPEMFEQVSKADVDATGIPHFSV
jgi:acetyl esterase/lipase